MTTAQRVAEVVEAVADFAEQNHRSPTIREIAQAMDCSPDTAWKAVKAAAAQGTLKHEPKRAGTLRVTGTPCPACGRE